MGAKVSRLPIAPCTSTMGEPWPERRAANLVPSADVIVVSVLILGRPGRSRWGRRSYGLGHGLPRTLA